MGVRDELAELPIPRSALGAVAWRLKVQVERFLFWCALFLPVLYLSLLLTRIHTTEKLLLFLGLLGLHVVALVGGRSHRGTADP